MIARLLISPDLKSRIGEIKNILASYAPNILNHPDLLYFDSESKLGIEQSREIKSHLSLKPNSLKGKIVILEDASKLTNEAQNALLKILEEPPIKALIILGAKSESDLLPTVISRCQIQRLPTSDNKDQRKENTQNIDQLINANIEQRFEYIEKLKDKDQFLKNLASYFHKNPKQYAVFLKELLEAEKWSKHNVNIRAILEYLMLVMP